MNKIVGVVGKYELLWLGSGIVLLGFLLGTDPLTLSLPILLIPFALFFIWVRSGILALGRFMTGHKKPGRKLRALAGGIAAVALLTLTLQSLGQLSWRDILLVLSLALGLGFYFYKTDLL